MALYVDDLYALASADTKLHRVARTKGGEYAGPCPKCGGKDRFHVWPADEYPHYWCRNCGIRGGSVKYLVEVRGFEWRDAYEALGIDSNAPAAPRPIRIPTSAEIAEAPSVEWQAAAQLLAREAVTNLWSPAGETTRDYLLRRGLDEEEMQRGNFGVIFEDRFEALDAWGVMEGPDSPEKIFIPKGIVIPYISEGQIWKINIRRPMRRNLPPGQKPNKYFAIHGGTNALYGADALQSYGVGVIVESEITARFLRTLIRDIPEIAVVATGSKDKCRESRWIARLALCSVVLNAMDPDAGGDAAADWWIKTLPGLCYRHRPLFKDPNDMYMLLGFSKEEVRDWLLDGVRRHTGAVMLESAQLQPIEGITCYLCGAPATQRDRHGRPYCSNQAPRGCFDADGAEVTPLEVTEADYTFACVKCGADGDVDLIYDDHGRAWCPTHAVPFLLHHEAESAPTEALPPVEPVIVPAAEEEADSDFVCSYKGCADEPYTVDSTGHLWCYPHSRSGEFLDFGVKIGFIPLTFQYRAAIWNTPLKSCQHCLTRGEPLPDDPMPVDLAKMQCQPGGQFAWVETATTAPAEEFAYIFMEARQIAVHGPIQARRLTAIEKWRKENGILA